MKSEVPGMEVASGDAEHSPAVRRVPTASRRLLLVAANDPWHATVALGDLVEEWLRLLPNVQVTRGTRTDLHLERLQEYDVLLALLRLGPEATTEEERALTGFVARVGGLLGVHNSTIFPEERQSLHDLWGARFARHPPYQPFTVRIVDRDHSITHDINDFQISDELYVLDRRPLDAHVLAVADHEGQPQPMAYTKPYGRGAIFYCALGHDLASWDHPAFRQLMVGGVGWLVNQAI